VVTSPRSITPPDADAFSLRFLAWLERDKPTLAASARPFGPWPGARALRMTLQRPGGAEGELELTMHNEELTFSFDCHHVHFEPGHFSDENACFAAALATIRELLSEKLAVIAWWKGSSPLRSQFLSKDEPIRAMPRGFILRAPDRVTVRSWLGTRDRDVLPAELADD
jgi:hypothetical protein